ncbi:MAG: type VI secretion system baseplate subunit TssG [Aliishimia sp.]
MNAPEDKAREDALGRGLFATLRALERRHPNKPRIGHSRRMSDEYVELGQDPHLAFPTSDLAGYEDTPDGGAKIRAQALGFYGPFGALPLNVTEEVLQWTQSGDDAFVRFTDLLSARFIQLFFRAWSDSHAITQFDHPDGDRFREYLLAISGVGTPGFTTHESQADPLRPSMVPLHAGRIRSPVRLRQMIENLLDANVRVTEHVPTWLEFEDGDRNKLGQRGSVGRDLFVGRRLQTANDRITLSIRAKSFSDYRRYLPGGASHASLADMVFWYLGKTMEVGVELSLPANEIPAAKLGATIELGWMAAFKPRQQTPASREEFVTVARFTLDPNGSEPQHATG